MDNPAVADDVFEYAIKLVKNNLKTSKKNDKFLIN